ncbi:DUF3955 domain-containing protein [Savagea faecisuis]|uniref:DUF3955 domain-containing protein n=1 Tax=Savagea faecisuis TaxID=1274803 RepID=A0ABW3GYY4_9BACL
MRVHLGWTFFSLVLSGMMLFTHAMTSYMDANGIVHEPFFFFVPLTYIVWAVVALFWMIRGVTTYVQRHIFT